MLRRIMVAYDFTESAAHALRWAGELARTTGAALGLVHVALTAPPVVAPEVVVPLAMPTPEDVAALEAELRAAARGAGCDAQVEVMVGAHVGAAIVARADERQTDLVVVGTHGRGPLVRALLGSTADYVVRHAHCPVVTLRDHAARRT